MPNGNLGPAELAAATEDFETEHEKTYGHCLLGYAVQAVALRLVATIPPERVTLSPVNGGAGRAKAAGQAKETRKAYRGNLIINIKKRGELAWLKRRGIDHVIVNGAVVVEKGTLEC